MSCNGCRVLRKGCSDACVLRTSIEWIDGAQPQANATVFVAKFFGRAGLVASLAAVPSQHRPALFRSLLYEACGRTINPVSGAAGLMWTGNWDLCQAAARAVLRGDSLRALSVVPAAFTDRDMTGLYGDVGGAASSSSSPEHSSSALSARKRKKNSDDVGHCSFLAADKDDDDCQLHLCLTPASGGRPRGCGASDEYSATTTCEDAAGDAEKAAPPALLNLFN